MIARVVVSVVLTDPERGTATAPAAAPAIARFSTVSVLIAVTASPRTLTISGVALRLETSPASLISALLMVGVALPNGWILPAPDDVRSIAVPARAFSAEVASLILVPCPGTSMA